MNDKAIFFPSLHASFIQTQRNTMYYRVLQYATTYLHHLKNMNYTAAEHLLICERLRKDQRASCADKHPYSCSNTPAAPV